MGHAGCVLSGCALALAVSMSCSSTPDLAITHPVPDAACTDTSGDRFVDCGNGTVTDTATGTIWLKNANCFGLQNWEAAASLTALLQNGRCGLTDRSSPGHWRLPTKDEWESVLKATCGEIPDAPALPDKAGTGCYASATPWASDVPPAPAGGWSSTPYATDDSFVWFADVYIGSTYISPKIGLLMVWPVRVSGSP